MIIFIPYLLHLSLHGNVKIICITVFDAFINIVVIGLWLKLNKKLETYKIEKCLNHD